MDRDLGTAWTTRFRIEVNSPSLQQTQDALRPCVKDAYLRWTRGAQNLFIGISPSPTWELIEGFWVYHSLKQSSICQRNRYSRPTRSSENGVRTFKAEGVADEQLAKGERREMDCMDCHNRPSHRFDSKPERAVDEAIALGLIRKDAAVRAARGRGGSARTARAATRCDSGMLRSCELRIVRSEDRQFARLPLRKIATSQDHKIQKTGSVASGFWTKCPACLPEVRQSVWMPAGVPQAAFKNTAGPAG